MNIGLMSLLLRAAPTGGVTPADVEAAPALLDNALFQDMIAQGNQQPVAAPLSSQIGGEKAVGFFPMPVVITATSDEQEQEGVVEALGAPLQVETGVATIAVVPAIVKDLPDALVDAAKKLVADGEQQAREDAAEAEQADVWQLVKPDGAVVTVSDASSFRAEVVEPVQPIVQSQQSAAPVSPEAAVIAPEGTHEVAAPSDAAPLLPDTDAVATVVPVAVQPVVTAALRAVVPQAVEQRTGAAPVSAPSAPAAEGVATDHDARLPGASPADVAEAATTDDTDFDALVDDVIQRIVEGRHDGGKAQTVTAQTQGQPAAQIAQQAAAEPAPAVQAGADAGDVQLLQAGQTQQPHAAAERASPTALLHARAFGGEERAPVTEQVHVTIRHAVKSGLDQVTIQLDPADLGRVDVRMDVKDGRAQILIAAENRDTLALLQRDARGLEQLLQQSGIQADANAMQFELKGGQQQAGGGQDEGTGGRFATGDEEEYTVADEAVFTDLSRYVVSVDQGLDIKV